jgi:Ca-activated chloride channel family protein
VARVRRAINLLTKGRSCTVAGRCLVCILYLVILPTVAWRAGPQEAVPPENSQSDQYTIKMNVDMVVLHATVQDHKRTPVSGLRKDNFKIYEDRALQQIRYFSHEDIPVTVGLVVDNSGSMAPKDPEVIAAALAFARSSNPQDQMFVVNFNERVSFGLPGNMPFTGQRAELKVALSRIRADGRTALYDAVAAALKHLKKGNRDKKVLIVVSDGGDNASKHTLAQVMAMAEQSDAVIYTLGLFQEEDPDKNPRVLRQLAKITGGEVFLPRSIEDAVPICERIATDIRTQYTLAYEPTNRDQNGSYRAIKVTAEASGRGRLSVRTRVGYSGPLKTQALAATGLVEHKVQH